MWCGPRVVSKDPIVHQDHRMELRGDDDERSYRVLQHLRSRLSNGAGGGRGRGERTRQHRAATPDRGAFASGSIASGAIASGAIASGAMTSLLLGLECLALAAGL